MPCTSLVISRTIAEFLHFWCRIETNIFWSYKRISSAPIFTSTSCILQNCQQLYCFKTWFRKLGRNSVRTGADPKTFTRYSMTRNVVKVSKLELNFALLFTIVSCINQSSWVGIRGMHLRTIFQPLPSMKFDSFQGGECLGLNKRFYRTLVSKYKAMVVIYW